MRTSSSRFSRGVSKFSKVSLFSGLNNLKDITLDPRYSAGYPNREVRQSLNESLLRHLMGGPPSLPEHSARLYDLLLANDFAGLETLFRALFASISYEWHTKNESARYEGYYASVFYSCFAALGLDVTVEDSSSHGRLDMAIRFNDSVYLFEFVGGGACLNATAADRGRSPHVPNPRSRRRTSGRRWRTGARRRASTGRS